MDAARLKEIAEFMFEDVKDWRKAVATYLGVDQTTVWRWEKRNRIPRAAEIAMELSFSYGAYRDREVARG